MATQLYRVPTQNNLQYTLAQQLNQGATSLVLNSDPTGIVRTPGVLVVDRVNASGQATPTVREYISFTGQATTTLSGLTKGLGGSTDQQHGVGAIVEFIPDVVWGDALYQVQTHEHDVFGTHISLASLYIAFINGNLSASGASLNGIFPSAASGAIVQMLGNGYPVAITNTNNIGSNGWISDSNTYTYASSNSITVPGNVASQYPKGTKIMFTNNSITYYGYVISSVYSSPNTTLTFLPNSDFSINNSTITNPSYSYQVDPQGFPGTFNISPTVVWNTGTPPSGTTTMVAKAYITGNKCTIQVTQTNSVAGANNTQINVSLPITPLGSSSQHNAAGAAVVSTGTPTATPTNSAIATQYDTGSPIYQLNFSSMAAKTFWLSGDFYF